MKNKTLKIPAIILIVGFIAAIAAYLLTGIIKTPIITEQDFNYSVTYKLNGETQIYEGVYRCRFEFVGEGIDPLERYYEGDYLSNPDDGYSAAYTIAKKDGLKLCIVNIFSNEYLMGDGEEGFLDDPYLVACLDIGHAEMRTAGDGAVNMIRKMGHRIKALHLHDNDLLHDSHQLPFSMNIDFSSVVKALKEIGYSGYFTLEAKSYLEGRNVDLLDGVKTLKDSAKRLADMFDKA